MGEHTTGEPFIPLTRRDLTDLLCADPTLAFLLSRMRYPDFPEPLGVFRDVEQDRYGDIVRRQITDAVAQQGQGGLQALVTGEETWSVE